MDINNVFTHFDKNSLIIFHSFLPSAGVYQGKRGLLQMLERGYNTAHFTKRENRILFIDEARGYSVIELTRSGVFRNNNKKFENLRSMVFIKWDMGTVSKMNIVDVDPYNTILSFMSKAEITLNKFLQEAYLSSSASVGKGSGKTYESLKQYLNDDITVNLINLFPQSFFLGTNIAKQPLQKKQTQHAGKNIVIKGKDAFIKFFEVWDKTFLDATWRNDILFSNESVIVSLKLLKPTPHFMPANERQKMQSLTGVYFISQFDDNGLIKNTDIIMNRPLNPSQMRGIENHLKQRGTSWEELITPLRSVMTTTSAKALPTWISAA